MSARRLWVAVAAALLLAASSGAQTVYTWKDDKGVVHFSDENPEGVKGVETLTLEAPAPLVTEGGEGGGEPSIAMTPVPGSEAGGGPGGPAGEPEAGVATGPAQVVMVGQVELLPLSDTQRRVRGRLRNTGGEPARRVSVRVVIADADTGNLCTAGEINGEPEELGPGDNGQFEGELSTPCFYGNPRIAYYPEWD